MNIDLLQQMLAEKLVVRQKHPEADLFIYNYSPTVQYSREWNEITLLCRGLILDAEMNYVARPFPKFFNWEELTPDQIPNEAFEVFDKMDGSLGILYWLNDMPFIATRGSFTSDQALHATHILHTKYPSLFPLLKKTETYLFEIIYPENRIVLDYGATDDLVLLAQMDTQTGKEMPIQDIGFPMVKRYDGIKDFATLKALDLPNHEGFVLRFESGFRMKIKFADYVRLHKIITQVTSVVIWEYLSEEKPFDELLEKVPDEFYSWVKQTERQLKEEYDKILTDCMRVFQQLDDRKATANYFLQQRFPHVLFALLDGKNPAPIIWKIIKPTFSKPFNSEI